MIDAEVEVLFNKFASHNFIVYMDFINWIRPSKQSNIEELKKLIHYTFDEALKKNDGDIHQIFNQFSGGQDKITRKVYI